MCAYFSLTELQKRGLVHIVIHIKQRRNIHTYIIYNNTYYREGEIKLVNEVHVQVESDELSYIHS